MKGLLLIISIFMISTCHGESIEQRISEIRSEFASINACKSYVKDSIDIMDESTEGGQLLVYKDAQGKTRKMVAVFYGESGKLIEEYYIKRDALFFSFTQQYEYNRPIYWTARVARENNDSICFDLSKSKITENRYYFDRNQKLIRWIDGAKIMTEEKRILIKVEGEVENRFNYLNSKHK